MMTRKLRVDEIAFISRMISNCPEASNYLGKLTESLVEEMDDGGMGGLRFVSGKGDRRLGCELAKTTFLDEDGIEVTVTLSLDNYGDLYELDSWKTNFLPLNRFPR